MFIELTVMSSIKDGLRDFYGNEKTLFNIADIQVVAPWGVKVNDTVYAVVEDYEYIKEKLKCV